MTDKQGKRFNEIKALAVKILTRCGAANTALDVAECSTPHELQGWLTAASAEVKERGYLTDSEALLTLAMNAMHVPDIQ